MITYQHPLVHNVKLLKFQIFHIFSSLYEKFAGYFLYMRLLQSMSLCFFQLPIRSYDYAYTDLWDSAVLNNKGYLYKGFLCKAQYS